MEITADFTEEILKIIEDFTESNKSVIWYYLSSFRCGGHEVDMNRLSGCRQPYAKALCLVVPMYYLYGNLTLVVVYEHSKLANPKNFVEGWHDDISMTDFKKTSYRKLNMEDSQQTAAIIDANATYEFHLWRSPRRISATTDRCKDFGDIWKNGICVHEGNKYGDHEHFYVIGSIHRK